MTLPAIRHPRPSGWRNFALLLPLPGLALVVPASGWSQSRTCVDTAGLIHAVRAVHEKQENVGVSMALTVDGRLVVSRALGFADLEHRVPATPGTVFGAASVTKALTAVAVLKLWTEGRLNLDAPVQRYVPSFPTRPEGMITPRLLATHRSGLPHPSRRTPELFATHFATATDGLVVFRDEPLVSTPGDKRVYSSSNYNLLAAIVETITGNSFADYLRTAVLEPAAMRSTRFDDVLAVIPHRAARYTFYHPWTSAESKTLLRVPTWDYSFNLGGGGLLSTAEDLARFSAALLGPGLLSAPARSLFFSDEWFGRVSPLGERFTVITGSNPGVQAALAIYPDRGIAAAVLANTWGRGSRSAEMVKLPSLLVRICTGSDAQ